MKAHSTGPAIRDRRFASERLFRLRSEIRSHRPTPHRTDACSRNRGEGRPRARRGGDAARWRSCSRSRCARCCTSPASARPGSSARAFRHRVPPSARSHRRRRPEPDDPRRNWRGLVGFLGGGGDDQEHLRLILRAQRIDRVLHFRLLRLVGGDAHRFAVVLHRLRLIALAGPRIADRRQCLI